MRKSMLKILPKALLTLPFAGLLMGNSSCQQSASAPPVRALKKIIDIGTISASNLQIPGGGTFDFASVAEQEDYVAFSASDGFAMRYLPPLSTVNPSPASSLKMSNKDMSIVMAASAKASSSLGSHWSTEASCMVNLPMAQMHTAVNSFEMVGGGGVTIGYNANGVQAPAVGSLNFQLQSAQLDLSMIATQPLSQAVLGAINVTADQTKTNLSATINLGLFSIGPNYWYQTPLSTVTMNALNKGVAAVKAALTKEEWYTRVLENDDFSLTIIGGDNVNLQLGDEVAVFNDAYYWSGTPCASTYVGGAAQNPVAVIKIIAVGDTISVGQVIMRTDENAVVGAKARLYKLHESATPNPAIDVSTLVNVAPVTPPTTTTLPPKTP